MIFNILNSKDLTIVNSTHTPDDFKGYDYHIRIEIEDEKGVKSYLECRPPFLI